MDNRMIAFVSRITSLACRTFLAAAVALTSITPATAMMIDGTDGTIYYRYKSPEMASLVNPPSISKDITAFYVGGVGLDFSEVLPMRPEWQDDNWVVKGQLPEGITFDAATRTFVGKPSAPATNVKVELEGFDLNANSIATAEATFDIYAIEGVPVTVNAYAHTGKYAAHDLGMPDGVAVESWVYVKPAPDGVNVNGRYYDGVPTRAFRYPVFMQGKDYRGQTVVTYLGKYVVQDSPTFRDIIPDNVKDLQPNGWRPIASFGPPQIEFALKDHADVDYYLEIVSGDSLPGDFVSNGKSKGLKLVGTGTNVPYDTAKIRWKAIDRDDVPGYSNWFTFGSGAPTPTCDPLTPYPYVWYTGQDPQARLALPMGATGTLHFELVSGSLPQGYSLNKDTGIISGVVTETSLKQPFTVRVDVTNDGKTVSKTCAYTHIVFAGQLKLKDTASQQSHHVRVNKDFAGSLSVEGGIPNYDTAFTSGQGALGFTSATQNTPDITIGGRFATAGNHNVVLTTTNPDGNTASKTVPVQVYDPLKVLPVDTIKIRQYDPPQVWGVVPYDDTTVIPDVNSARFPILTLDKPSLVPTDIEFGGPHSLNGFYGSTSQTKGIVGPFVATITDFTGETAPSNPFLIEVLERADMVAKSTTNVVFKVESVSGASDHPFEIEQPYGAIKANLAVTWAYIGPALPPGVTFDPTKGDFVENGTLAYEDKGEYGPYTVTATDSEGYDATSSGIMISVQDWPEPAANSVPLQTGNVTGDASKKQSRTFMATPELRPYIKEDTVHGGQAGVTFTSAVPSDPAGLAFNYTTGEFTGEPTSEYKGDVVVTFQDTKGRVGKITIPMEVRQYPAASMPEASYDIPRLSDVATLNVAARADGGFWGNIQWSEAPGVTFPAGLTVDPLSGMIVGKTTLPETTPPFAGLVIQARDLKTGLVTFTEPFTINIVKQTKMKLEYNISGDEVINYNFDRDPPTLPDYTHHSGPTGHAPVVKGSFVDPLAYSLPQLAADPDLAGLMINKTSGRLSGTPQVLFKEYPLTVRVTDAEGKFSEVTVPFTNTLEGGIRTTDGSNSLVLRENEPFLDPVSGVRDMSNNVGTVRWETDPALLPLGLNFDPLTGVYNNDSNFLDVPSPIVNKQIVITAKDDHDRPLEKGLSTRFTVYPRLKYELSRKNHDAKRFENSVDISFPAATYPIGKITYSASGINSAADVPGTLVSTLHDAADALVGYAWKDGNGDTQEIDVSDTGAVTAHRVGGVSQQLKSIRRLNPVTNTVVNVVADTVASYLPFDALVFDRIDRTLTGKPSKAGIYSLVLAASDDHQDGYIKDLGTKSKYNRASDSFQIAVVDADPLAFNVAQTQFGAVRYSATDFLNVTFPAAINVVEDVTYDVVGDLPGTLVYKAYDDLGQFLEYVWKDGSTTHRTSHKDALPLDALVLDGLNHTLSGIPSKEGVFVVRLTAKDTHAWEHDFAESDPITITVSAAADMVATNSSNADTANLYTSTFGLVTDVANTAYGKGIKTWTAVSGILPANIAKSASGARLGYAGYPDNTGVFSGIVWKGVDYAGREIVTDAVTLEVKPRLPLELVASSNPVGLVVNSTDASVTVTPKNSAYGLAIPQGDWTVTGVSNLPPGVDWEYANGKIRFKGIATLIGEFTGIVVHATDSKGGSASLTMTFKVLVPTDAIGLEVSNIRTKPNVPFDMQPTTSNTYGTPRFYSYDITGPLANSLSINSGTGLVKGQFSASQQIDFDVYVTDDTNRVTSKPVVVEIIPNLRLTVPTVVEVDQGAAVAHTIGTDYILGTVKYRKLGTWPAGLDIDPDTGKIVGTPTAAVADYPGLEIEGTDSWSSFTDTQPSNTFTIRVNPIKAKPDIKDPVGKQLYTVGVPMGFTPTVVDSVLGQPWNYGSTVYELNHDIKADTGLDFDPNTGVISGTATKPIIYDDLTIRVTSARGDTDITSAYWFGVQPAGPIVSSAGQTTAYKARVGADFKTDAPVFTNWYGDLTYTRTRGPSISVNASTGIMQGTPLASMVKDEPHDVTVQIKDEFGRTANLDYTLLVKPDMVLTAQSQVVDPAVPVSDLSVASVTNVLGTAVWSATGLPLGLSMNASTGLVSGTVDKNANYDPGQVFPVTITVVDSHDNRTKMANINIELAKGKKARFWRLRWSVNSTQHKPTLNEFQLLDENGVNHSLRAQSGGDATDTSTPISNWGAASLRKLALDGSATTGVRLDGTSGYGWLALDFGTDTSKHPVVTDIYYLWSGSSTSDQGLDVHVEASDDGSSWSRVAAAAPGYGRSGTLKVGQ